MDRAVRVPLRPDREGGELEWFGRFFDQGLMSWDETQRQFEVFAKEITPYFR
jgi:hypothetical protein